MFAGRCGWGRQAEDRMAVRQKFRETESLKNRKHKDRQTKLFKLSKTFCQRHFPFIQKFQKKSFIQNLTLIFFPGMWTIIVAFSDKNFLQKKKFLTTSIFCNIIKKVKLKYRSSLIFFFNSQEGQKIIDISATAIAQLIERLRSEQKSQGLKHKKIPLPYYFLQKNIFNSCNKDSAKNIELVCFVSNLQDGHEIIDISAMTIAQLVER